MPDLGLAECLSASSRRYIDTDTITDEHKALQQVTHHLLQATRVLQRRLQPQKQHCGAQICSIVWIGKKARGGAAELHQITLLS